MIRVVFESERNDLFIKFVEICNGLGVRLHNYKPGFYISFEVSEEHLALLLLHDMVNAEFSEFSDYYYVTSLYLNKLRNMVHWEKIREFDEMIIKAKKNKN